ncbi:MAG: choice-of-anchor C family protein, partial [Candidatus Latescibacterota bacterium]
MLFRKLMTFVSVLIMTYALVGQACAQPSWVVESIDTFGSAWGQGYLAIDSQNKPHIIFYDTGDGSLKYGVRTGGSWVIESLGINNLGYPASLALDSQDIPHISYHNGTTYSLKYAVKSGATWIIETVDGSYPIVSAGQYNCIALDSQDNPHISYSARVKRSSQARYYNQDLRYAHKKMGSWTIETLDAHPNAAERSFITVDSQDNIHIGYCHNHYSDLKYVYRSSGSDLLGDTLQANGSFEAGPDPGESLQIDPGSTDITEWLVIRDQIDYMGSYWVHAHGQRSLDLDGSVGQGGISQALSTKPGKSYRVSFYLAGDPNGSPQLKQMGIESAGYSYSNYWFDVTTTTVADMGWAYIEWDFIANDTVTTLQFYSMDPPPNSYGPALDHVVVTEIMAPVDAVDAASTTGFYPSLAVDSQDRPHICYADALNNIRYAVKSGSSWTKETITSPGRYPSLQLDSQDNPHISYNEFWISDYRDLKYMAKLGGAWYTWTVNSDESFYSNSSLALDSQDNIHIAFNSTGGDAKGIFYATRDEVTSVTLVSFVANRAGEKAVLRWEISDASVDHCGFDVYRSSTGTFRDRINEGILSGHTHYEFIDADAPLDETRYWLKEVNESGKETWYGPVTVPHVQPFAAKLSLGASYPNPFNPTTTIPFAIPEMAGTKLAIYDAQGRLVKTLFDGIKTPGNHKEFWDGMDEKGKEVASGVYFVRLESR